LKRFVLVSVIPSAVFRGRKLVVLHVSPLGFEELKSMVDSWGEKARIISYIAHPAVARAVSQAIGRELEYCREPYRYEPSDAIVVVVPKKRVHESLQLSPDDLEAYLVTVETP